MKLPLTLTVHVELDEIEMIIGEIKSLQTYKLSEKDEMLLVSREAVADVLARHIKTRVPEQGAEWVEDVISGILHCSNCGGDAPLDTTGGGQYKSRYCPGCGCTMRNPIGEREL